MFRRDKESKLDNEGLRRMREAIRQRLDQEGDEAGNADEVGVEPYRQSGTATSDDTAVEVAPFDPETLGDYGASDAPDSNYSFLTSGRQDRTLPAFEVPAIPARAETPSWTPSRNETPAWVPTTNEVANVPAALGPASTTVAADTTWNGTLRSSGTIQIDGTFEGKIETEQGLIVSADGRVEATVHAASITVAGDLNGQINCQGRLEILATGRVSGQIDAGSFVVHEGAYLGGQVRMTSASANDAGARPVLQRVR